MESTILLVPKPTDRSKFYVLGHLERKHQNYSPSKMALSCTVTRQKIIKPLQTPKRLYSRIWDGLTGLSFC